MSESTRYLPIMDTTLRDGEQTQGVSFSPDEKVNLAKALLELVLVVLRNGVALGMSFPRGRTDMNGLSGRLLLIPRRSVFSCGATCS